MSPSRTPRRRNTESPASWSAGARARPPSPSRGGHKRGTRAGRSRRRRAKSPPARSVSGRHPKALRPLPAHRWPPAAHATAPGAPGDRVHAGPARRTAPRCWRARAENLAEAPRADRGPGVQAGEPLLHRQQATDLLGGQPKPGQFDRRSTVGTVDDPAAMFDAAAHRYAQAIAQVPEVALDRRARNLQPRGKLFGRMAAPAGEHSVELTQTFETIAALPPTVDRCRRS